MTPKIKITLTPYELLQLDIGLGRLVLFRNDADAWERCVMTTLLLWHMKIKRLAMWPKPEGNKITLDATVAYALIAVIKLDELNPSDPLGCKLLDLADKIKRTFFQPIYNPLLTTHDTDTNGTTHSPGAGPERNP